ncbi:MAG: hypothetical protein ACLP3R_01365 [Candidatus Korobacteraceae bacterium]
MSQEVTITLPAIDDTTIADLAAAQTTVIVKESDAVRLLRETYAKYARHAGFVRIADHDEKNYYYMHSGKKVHALLICDGFYSTTSERDRGGCLLGSRLYLTEHDQWLEITRFGHWSQYVDSPGWWSCDPSIVDVYVEPTGSTQVLTDEQVRASYKLSDILSTLAKSLTTMSAKLPQRLTKVRRDIELAAQVIAALFGTI